MTENRISHLCKISAALQYSNSLTLPLLKCFYLMKCHEVATSKLTHKQFSPDVRCSYCCSAWTEQKYDAKISPVKLSKKQRKRLRKKKGQQNLDHVNQLERKCSICNHTTTILLIKPHSEDIAKVCKPVSKSNTVTIRDKSKEDRKNKAKQKSKITKTSEANLYANTREVFSLKNEKNNLSSINKEAKVIKNNKRKKDKFAGLCKEAVLATAKMAETKKKQDKINLFLKPC